MRNLTVLFFLSFFIVSINLYAKNIEGYVNVTGGKIWYTIINSESKGIPIIIVHGGPGGRSCRSIPIYSLLSDDRPVILYDQLESGYSDRPNDTSLWKLRYFVDQLDSLQKELKLETFHLLGSSWGAAIAVEYLLTIQSTQVASVIFSGPLLSTPKWIEDANILLSQLDQKIQDTIRKYEALKDYNAPAYMAATDTFYANYMWRSQSFKIEPGNCDDSKGFNAKIYNHMWGPTEFTATGTLKSFDRIADLHKLDLPVLFIVGEYDEVRVETAYEYQQLVEGSKVSIVPNAGHAKIYDAPYIFTDQISTFLTDIEN